MKIKPSRAVAPRAPEETMRATIAVMPAFTVAAVALSASAFLACGGAPPPKTADDTKPAPVEAPTNRLPDKAPDSPTASAVRISDEIVKACGINEPDAYFAFDSSTVRPDDSKVLQQVVVCFTTGPLKGRTLKLVGHADPRGGRD